MVLLESRWDRPWTPVVNSFDAGLFGHGVAEAPFDPTAVADIGRASELGRRRLGAGLARERAFESAGILPGGDASQVMRGADGPRGSSIPSSRRS